MTTLTKRFTDAVDHVRIAHAAQFRKGTQTPYVYHLLAVSSLVLEFGGNEDQAIAGLLHDVIEDCGESHRAVVRATWGDAVADLEDPEVGRKVFDRFTAGQDGTLRYYHALAALFVRKGVPPSRTLEGTVTRMYELAGVAERLPLTQVA